MGVRDWDINDLDQIKGLLCWPKDGPVWRKAPEAMKKKALELEATGWKPNDHEMPDIARGDNAAETDEVPF